MSERVSVERALAWIDAAAIALEAEDCALGAAGGRVLAGDLRGARPIPCCDCAALDGFAVAASDTLGAASYNPVALPAAAIAAGEPVPQGADAIVPSAEADLDEHGSIVLVAPLAPGAHVDRAGTVAGSGTLLAAAGTVLTPRHLGLLAVAGHARLPLIRRPLVRLAVAGRPRSGPSIDGNGPMLRALIARDGGVVTDADLADVFAAAADLVIVAGGTGSGSEDRSREALAAAGTIELRSVALNPGETAAFGRTAGGAPALLLPGSPPACLWTYELFAGRAVRRLGGRNPALPYPSRFTKIARKIVSSIGMTEISPIRLLPDGRIEPIASFSETGLQAAVAGDGFAVVPEASEGYPADAEIIAYFYASG